jgi:hypothetical protein
MKSVNRVPLNGFRLADGPKKLGLYAIAVGLLLLLSCPISAKAETITQGECLQWLVQVTGDSGQFSPTSTAADLIQWARVKGMNPNGGWQPNAILTREALAEILVQLFGLNPKKFGGGDYARILAREGIELPTDADISRASLVSVLGELTFQTRIVQTTIGVGSPNRKGNAGKGNGEDPPPPGWNQNPRNPHFGQGEPPGQ